MVKGKRENDKVDNKSKFTFANGEEIALVFFMRDMKRSRETYSAFSMASGTTLRKASKILFPRSLINSVIDILEII